MGRSLQQSQLGSVGFFRACRWRVGALVLALLVSTNRARADQARYVRPAPEAIGALYGINRDGFFRNGAGLEALKTKDPVKYARVVKTMVNYQLAVEGLLHEPRQGLRTPLSDQKMAELVSRITQKKNVEEDPRSETALSGENIPGEVQFRGRKQARSPASSGVRTRR